jgi:hypothetical protein
MDLKHILNPMPEAKDPPPRVTNNTHRAEAQSGETPNLPRPSSTSYLHSKFFLSPRRLDPETASVSTNSSGKRRRTNRGRIDVDNNTRSKPGQSAAMGRSFSELEVPSDTSSIDDDNDTVKRGVAQLSLSGILPNGQSNDIDEYANLKPGTRVEALKSGTQGTWYVARIVEFASFPSHYIDGDASEDIPHQWYPMVCVHYEGT